jgi:dTDP-4-amino-4,6-dideoxygalactose transaminase
VDAGRIRRPRVPAGTTHNYSYYPVIFGSESDLLRVQAALNTAGVFPRRYFYPALNTLPYVSRQGAPIAESVAARVLCLPLSHHLTTETVSRVCQIVADAL